MNQKVKCQICDKELNNINSLSRHIGKVHKKDMSGETYYKTFLMKTNENICKMYGKVESCKKYTTFKSLKNGFATFCSCSCFGKDPSTVEKLRINNKKTYKEKGQEIKKKIEKTNLKRYGIKDPNQLQCIKDKIKKVNLEKYGVEYNQQNKEVQNKTRQTNLRKRGVECSFSCPKIIKKSKKTNLRKRGVEWAAACPEIIEQRKQTYLKKTGYDNPAKNPEVIEKTKKTWIKNLGVDNPSKSHMIRRKKEETRIKNLYPKVIKYFKTFNIELLSNYTNSAEKLKLKCLKCSCIFEESIWKFQQGHLCPKCYPRENGTSIAEKEVYKFICKLIGKDKVEHNCYSIIKNPNTSNSLELDIYIPDKQIAIEYNGLYWHSELVLSRFDYHLQKTNLCKEKGIYLIHIFEDEWIFKKEIVKSRIKQILKVNDSERIHARKCEIKEIDPKVKNEFLEEFHIQGKDASKIKLGAFHNKELVSVMTFGKGNISKGSKSKEGVWELNRFCSNSNYHIPGIAGKLLSHFKKNYEWKEIFSYADRRWSTGNLYYQLGFELNKITQPNYWYLKGFERIHRFGLRKTKDEPKDIPEWILRQNEGYTRIWDCGNLKFKLYS